MGSHSSVWSRERHVKNAALTPLWGALLPPKVGSVDVAQESAF